MKPESSSRDRVGATGIGDHRVHSCIHSGVDPTIDRASETPSRNQRRQDGENGANQPPARARSRRRDSLLRSKARSGKLGVQAPA
jgi:hypothetical protein